MGAGVGSALAQGDLAQRDPGAAAPPDHVPPLKPDDWPRVKDRLCAYLAAMGVHEPLAVERLGEQIRARVEARAAISPLEDPVESAIEEAHALLDRWLVAELGLEGDADALCAARAAVLGGGVPGWSARWAGLAEVSPASEIRALCIPAVPESAPLTMEPSTIDLFLHRLGCRVAAGFNRLLCRAADPKATARGHP